MFVSARLALLASLLSALALPFVDAAYLPSRHSETQNVHRFSPGLLPPRFGRHSPVSGRHRVHTDNEHAHDKVLNSVFSRHRYRRDSGTLTRRSSVYVLGDHGDKYLVSRSAAVSNEQNSSSRVHGRRQSNQVVGRVDVMGPAQSSDSLQRLASLAVDSTPTDWTPGQDPTKVFGVNASTSNRTQFIMMVLDAPSDTTSFNKHVSLAVQVFDADIAEMVMYCATYDPDPAAASALVMAPCATPSVASVTKSDNATDTTPLSNPHQSQIFSYDPFSGQIQPTTSVANTDTSGEVAHCGSEERRDIVNSTTSSTSATASNTQPSAAPTPSPSQRAQNVTLMYVPEEIEVPASSRSLGTTNASQGREEAVVTTTITTTVVATVTASTSSRKSPTPAQAAASVLASTTSTATSIFTSSSTPSTSATASSKSSSVANESLEIEIVGVPPTTTASSSSISSTTTTRSSASTALNAQAVASSIANARPSKSLSSSSATAMATPVVVALSRRSRMFGRM